MVHHESLPRLRMKVCQLVDPQEHTSSFLINIRAALSRIIGEDSKVQRVSASWLQQLSVFFFESQKKTFPEVQRRQGRPGMPTSGVVVDRFSRDFGTWTTAIIDVFTAMP